MFIKYSFTSTASPHFPYECSIKHLAILRKWDAWNQKRYFWVRVKITSVFSNRKGWALCLNCFHWECFVFHGRQDFFLRVSYCIPDCPGTTMYPRLASNSWQFCFSRPKNSIIDISHNAWLRVVFNQLSV